MTDDELLVVLITTVVLWLGYQVNKWKIDDLEDRVKRLEEEEDDKTNMETVQRSTKIKK
jgi:hypothetical protein